MPTTAWRLAVLASGNGSNALNLIRAFRSEAHLEVALVISNRRKAPVLAKAEAEGVPALWQGKDAFASGQVLEALRAHQIDGLLLAGFMQKVPPYLIAAFPRRILNIHPALLPKFGGRGMYGQHVHEAVLAAGEAESGISIHLVDEEYDRGPLLFQAKVPVAPQDTPQSLAAKIHELEYLHYPEVAKRYFRGELAPSAGKQ